MLRKLAFYIFAILLVVTFAASSVSAQVSVTPGLELSLSSSNPVPGQTLTITARSYTEDASSATIIWYVDGKEVKRGVGATTLEIKAPVLGKRDTIRVRAIIPQGGEVGGEITLGSGSVDLIVESDGYVPPLFPGKISPSFQNNVKIIAIPHLANAAGVEYDSKTLIYEWQRNDIAIEGQSGYGKRSVTIEGAPVPRPYTMSVTVRSRDGISVTKGYITISPQVPTLSFYVDDPLYGPLFNKAIMGQVNLGSQRESSVLAVPFGFNKPQNGVGNLSYEWTVNGSLRSDLLTNQSIILRAPDESAGSSRIGLTIKNGRDILQGALGGFTVLFSAPSGESSISF
jgi:hypothetical protein